MFYKPIIVVLIIINCNNYNINNNINNYNNFVLQIMESFQTQYRMNKPRYKRTSILHALMLIPMVQSSFKIVPSSTDTMRKDLSNVKVYSPL